MNSSATYIDPAVRYTIDELYYMGYPVEYCPNNCGGVRFQFYPQAPCKRQCYMGNTITGARLIANYNTSRIEECPICQRMYLKKHLAPTIDFDRVVCSFECKENYSRNPKLYAINKSLLM